MVRPRYLNGILSTRASTRTKEVGLQVLNQRRLCGGTVSPGTLVGWFYTEGSERSENETQ